VGEEKVEGGKVTSERGRVQREEALLVVSMGLGVLWESARHACLFFAQCGE